MFNLTASLSFTESEITVKASNANLFNQILQTVTAINNGEAVATSSYSNEDNRDAIEVYEEYCKGVGENLSLISVKNRTSVRNYVRTLFNGKKLNEIDRKAMFEIKNNLDKLPVYLYNKDFYNQKKLLKDLPSYKKSFSTVTPGTQDRIFTMLVAFFNWCVAKGYKDTNPFDKQKLFNEKVQEEKVVAYTQKDLEKLFVGDAFKRFHTRFSARYWIPLFSLYTGARRSEIAALDVDDIKTDKFGRWYISVNTNSKVPGKKKLVKNDHSARLIPIHNKLLELGFKRYFETIKEEGYPVLFPDVVIKSKGLVDGDAISVPFSTYRQELKIEGHKTLHSLRHNAVACLKHKKCHLPDIQQLIGHAFGNITFDVYGEPSDMSEMFDLVNKIDYNLNIESWSDSELKKHTRERVWNKTKTNLRINS